MKNGPNGSNRRRRLYTPQSKQTRVIAASLAGKSNREISRQIGIKRDTVARILSQPEVQELIGQYRQQVRELVPLCLAGLDAKLVTAKGKLRNRTDWRMLVEILKGTQVLVPKLEEEVTKKDEFEGRSREELRFFIEHGGSWPEELGSTGESGEEAEGTRSGRPLPN